MAVFYYNRGIEHYDQKQFVEAISDLGRALKIEPDNIKIHYTLASAYLQTDDEDRAIEEFKATLKLSADYESAYLHLAQLYLNRQSYGQLFEIIDLARENNVFNDELAGIFREATFQFASDYVTKGTDALLSNNKEEGYSYLEQAIQIDPEFAYPSYVAGFFYYKDQEYQRAKGYIQEAVRIDPRFGAAHKLLGDIFFAQRDFAAAIDEYRTALNLNYKDANLLNDFALAMMEAGDHQEALKHIKAASEARPDNINMRYNLACLYRDNGDFQKAILEFNRLIEQQPDYPNAHNELADIYVKEGKLQEANQAYLKEIEHASEKIKSEPPDAVILNSLARAYNGVKKYQEAKEFAEKAIQLLPNYREAYKALARIQENLGDDQGAQATLKEGDSISAQTRYIPRRISSNEDIILDQNYTIGIDGVKISTEGN